MKKLFCIIFTLTIILGMVVSASAGPKEDVKIYYMDDGTAVVGTLGEGDLSGWCAVYLTGEYDGCVFWGFFQEGKASGALCMEDGTSILATYENEKLTTQQEAVQKADAAQKNDETKVTVGMENALKSAKMYLSLTGFSYKGLVKQLEFEGYSENEATYAADHCGADWNEQAVRSAKQYMSLMAFSRSGLIKQLEFDGYTSDQAAYAATQCGY